ncbi:hypothetical protein CWB68_20825, partial [Pseudoalteromonas sp. S979]
NMSDEIKKFWEEISLSISNIVETACLMHDIGYAPCGHFGEADVSEWAGDIVCKGWFTEMFKDEILRKAWTWSLTHFDGKRLVFIL